MDIFLYVYSFPFLDTQRSSSQIQNLLKWKKITIVDNCLKKKLLKNVKERVFRKNKTIEKERKVNFWGK